MVSLPRTRAISFIDFNTYTFHLTSKYGGLKRTGQSFDVLADHALNIGIVVHTSCHVERARDATS